MPRIGVAVSGGGDSMALLDLLRQAGAPLAVVSVDHGLRPEARHEIALVAQYCSAHGLDHDILQWQWDQRGSVQHAARDGRSASIAAWARDLGLRHVALGHTADDQAETVLMRLARGSGVDGLAAMRDVATRNGVHWLRPLLDTHRETLRVHLRESGIGWADDPSNEDPTYDRVKARQALKVLAPLGLNVERLTRTAAHMGRARNALEYALDALVRDAVTLESGDVVIAQVIFSQAPQEIQTRLVARALNWVSGQTYKPRFSALQATLARPEISALQGCLLIQKAGKLRITREWAAVAKTRCDVTSVWDGRWVLAGPHEKGQEVRALGEGGLAQCAEWRATGLSRQSLLASPSVWHGESLLAAPLAGLSEGWYAEIIADRSDFC
ncbi:tRNA lysidine(34) synthetase TilS [Roseobacter sp.]|uniref:tRNA lysidine(34) synthetase TilS n=1 Tax=Roseobacter sp. TaxID=1907202 RepID=UPI00329A793B